MNKPRDDKCAQLYHALIAHKQRHNGTGLDLRALCRKAGISSTSVASAHLIHLEEDGLIRKPASATRSVEVVGGSWVPYDVDVLVETLRCVAEQSCCETPGCCMEDPMCTAMLARGALHKVGLR